MRLDNDRPPCGDCAAAGHTVPAEYTCMEDACNLQSLCNGHSVVHKGWGHVVGMLVNDVASHLPPPDSLLGVTHCKRPEHAGMDGVFTHVCTPCDAVLCRKCVDDHLGVGHKVFKMDAAGVHFADYLRSCLVALESGAEAHFAKRVQIERTARDLVLMKHDVVGLMKIVKDALQAAVLHQYEDAVRAAEDTFCAKAATLAKASDVVCAKASELQTVASAVRAVLDGAHDHPISVVHMAKTAAASLALQSAGPALDEKALSVPSAAYANSFITNYIQQTMLEFGHCLLAKARTSE